MMNLQKLRQKSKLTQNEVANRMGISPRTYWDWEKGNTEPRASQMEKLLKVFEKGSQNGIKK